VRNRLVPALFGTLLLTGLALPADGQTKLLRFPDIHGEEVVFTYGGDLWKASAHGGTALRLTAHPGMELFGKFSPDGRWIAFTGQYDGDEQVYVVPATGGEPRQLTYYPARGPMAPRWGYDNQVYGWTPDGTGVLFGSLRDADGGRTERALYVVPLAGGLPRQLPMPTAGAGDLAPDGRRIVYSPLFRDFRTWKRYEGGWAQHLYIFDLETHVHEPVAHTVRTERDPMWAGDAIYFVSDRDDVLNLYRYDLGNRQVEQLTHEREWDVRWASSDGQRRIVYELDGELVVYDVQARQSRKLAIHVPDDGINRRPSRVSAEKQITSYALSPKGERALFSARGDVFTVPVEHGATRNLTSSSRSHDKHARWSPDGRRIAFVSDRSGEEQLYLVDQNGHGAPQALTTDLAMFLFAPSWAGDGERLAIGDADGRLHVISVADRRRIEIARDPNGPIWDYDWSADGGHLAFSMQEPSGFRSLYLWSVADGQVRKVGNPLFHERAPSFDPEGRFLYFLSDRDYAPQISNIEWNFAGNRRTGVYAMALRRDVAHPFPPKSDEVTFSEPEEEAASTPTTPPGKGAANQAIAKQLVIDYDGLASRVTRVPIEADNIGAVAAVGKHLLYSTSGASFYGRQSYEPTRLRIYDLEKRETSVLVDEIDGWALSHDGSKVLVRQKESFALYEVKPKGAEKKAVATRGLAVDRVPADEWANIFDEVWRRYRDFFYARNMHGYDWQAIGERYRRWVPHLAHRTDLNYLIGEMIAELNVGHAYIEGGDFQLPERPPVGLPGARFALDEASGRYRIDHIFVGHNEEPGYRSPLTEVGVEVREGDYVLAIDGVELTADDNPYRLLRHKTDPVSLTVNSRPTLQGARQTSYVPIRSEANLLYLQWVEGNRQWVDQRSGGRVGYLHIPDMGASGAYEFLKWFYPQVRKEGLVVDVRSNGGGNISQWIIERLSRPLLGTRFGRWGEQAQTYPYTVFHGHMVALLNETSASDGDIFPHRFRDAGLGPLIGKRSWGGVVGITSFGPLLDGGNVFVPIQGTNDPAGNWIIEGIGVAPDIEVENDPASVIAGRDPQLERGLAEVLAAIEREPRQLPPRPADPIKVPEGATGDAPVVQGLEQ
jgi:tricorn protease